MANAFAVEFEVLRSSVVSEDPETYSVTLLIQQYWRKQAACCASTSSAAHCHVDLSWYKWHGDPQVSREGLAVLFGFVVRPWRSERVEAVGFQSFLYEQRSRICFKSHQNTRAAQKIKLNGKCIRHSDVFVWNGVWFFAQLFSYPCAAMSLLYGNQSEITWLWSYNGLNPAAGFWRFHRLAELVTFVTKVNLK